ncbi:MAG: helix-turn-helix transcriptional regulator [Xanthobacteraceae bacterium]|nr:helix-turn-helix transcriptional regulator [Xanthobacteraceae bacterium]
MFESTQFERLVGDIYDAAIDPVRWSDTLIRLGHFVGGDAGGMVSRDFISKTGSPHCVFGFDPEFVRLYMETHSKLDPHAGLPLFGTGRILSVPDLIPPDEFYQGRFFQEWMRPQTWIDTATVVIEKSASRCLFLTVLRSKASGLVDDDMRRRMQLVGPHVRRAMLVDRAIDSKTTEVAALSRMLDGLSAGVFFVDDSCRVVRANAAGEDMLSACNILRMSGGRLCIAHSQSDRALSAAVAAAGRGDEEAGVKGVAIPLIARDETRYVAHVLPLASGERRDAGMPPAAVAAVFVRKAELGAPSAPELIARSYQLTPTELRVLLAIVEIGGVRETAELLGIGEGTVKTHLHRLFGKTGAARQAELVKLVAGYSSPLVH